MPPLDWDIEGPLSEQEAFTDGTFFTDGTGFIPAVGTVDWVQEDPLEE